jgi:hypothetical protein
MGASSETIQGTTFDNSVQSNIFNGFQTIKSSNSDPAAKNLSLVIGATAGLITFSEMQGLNAAKGFFDNFGKASSIFDTYILHDTTTTTTTENITTNTSLINSQMSAYAETFALQDQNSELDVDLYYDSFFGTIAFNPIGSHNAPQTGALCARHVTGLPRGDFNGDNFSDIAVTGGPWQSIALGRSNGDGSFAFVNGLLTGGDTNFPMYATEPGAKALPGDFNGDGIADVALTGVNGWETMPIALSNGDGTFYGTNGGVGWGDTHFPEWAGSWHVMPVAGDFDGDGYNDIVLTGGPGWNTIPVAYSNGDGTFNVLNVGDNSGSDLFPQLAAQDTVKAVGGDFDGDGTGDIALLGTTDIDGSAWGVIPVEFSGGGFFGGFFPTYGGITSGDQGFTSWVQIPGAQPVVGDFNGDGRSDIALVGGIGWASIPIAFSNGDGTFWVANILSDSMSWNGESGTRPVAGDFNGDGLTDIVVLGTGPGSNGGYFVTTELSTGNGGFIVGFTDEGGTFPTLGGVTTGMPVSTY